MTTRVITPPGLLLTPADIPGDHEPTDDAMTALIAAAQDEIDGPAGWLGRAIVPQTLEVSGWIDCERVRLPCPPLIEIVSVITEDRSGIRHVVPPELYSADLESNELVVARGATWTRQPFHRVRYRAGYNDVPVADGGTGPVPERVKQALILAVLHAKQLAREDLFLRSEQVEGIGTTTYTLSTVATELIQGAISRQLEGLRVYA